MYLERMKIIGKISELIVLNDQRLISWMKFDSGLEWEYAYS